MPCPVITIAQMREWERASWAAGRKEEDVIERVGRCVASTALRLTRPGALILVLAGKGNNGKDARSAQQHLGSRRVITLDVLEPAADFDRLEVLLSQRPALIIDGLFGIGLDRPLSSEWVRFIEGVNQSRTPVLAVDVPSGLDADTGEPQGAAVQASVTLTVAAPKAGLLQEAAWPFVGRVEVASDVGLAPYPGPSEIQWTMPRDLSGYPPPRPAATHKGDLGHLAIVAGSPGYHGAAVLAARGAQRAQPGLITLYTMQGAYLPIAAQLQAVMVSAWQPGNKLPGSPNALLLGPGLAAADLPDQMKILLRNLWRDLALPLIVDASALDWVPLDPTHRNALRVVTPHPGEAARLLRSSPQQVQANRFNAVREISKRFGNTWVVLKGYQTIIGRGSGEMFVNPSGNPHLAQGGSGDVLAGYIAGLLAQPSGRADVLKTLRYAVWQHGAAADRLQATRRNWVVEELADEIGAQDPEQSPSEPD